jgi:hypothetical protein
MADETKESKDGPRRSPVNAETLWFAIPGIAIVAFFVWVLAEMGSAGGGGTLVRMLLGIAATVGGGLLIFVLLGRLSRD